VSISFRLGTQSFKEQGCELQFENTTGSMLGWPPSAYNSRESRAMTKGQVELLASSNWRKLIRGAESPADGDGLTRASVALAGPEHRQTSTLR